MRVKCSALIPTTAGQSPSTITPPQRLPAAKQAFKDLAAQKAAPSSLGLVLRLRPQAPSTESLAMPSVPVNKPIEPAAKPQVDDIAFFAEISQEIERLKATRSDLDDVWAKPFFKLITCPYSQYPLWTTYMDALMQWADVHNGLALTNALRLYPSPMSPEQRIRLCEYLASRCLREPMPSYLKAPAHVIWELVRIVDDAPDFLTNPGNRDAVRKIMRDYATEQAAPFIRPPEIRNLSYTRNSSYEITIRAHEWAFPARSPEEAPLDEYYEQMLVDVAVKRVRSLKTTFPGLPYCVMIEGSSSRAEFSKKCQARLQAEDCLVVALR